MDIDEHLTQLAADGPLLAAAARRAGWDAPVPGTTWTVRELVTHVGGVHRWAAAVVADPGRVEAEAQARGTGPGDDELLEWFGAGHAAIVSTLRSAPADLTCFTMWAAPSPLAFWARRQAHETAIHRADAEAAAGAVTAFDAAFADDGVAEMLGGFARSKRYASSTPGSLELAPQDGGTRRRLTFGGERIESVDGAGAGPADATIVGRTSDVYLWLWNRPSAAQVLGDAGIAELWRQVRVVGR